MRRAHGLVAGVVASLALAGTATAQTPRDTTAARPDAFCWRGRPLPRCRAFALFELGWFEAPATSRLREPYPFADMGVRDDAAFGRHLSWTLGAMRNTDARTALGGAVLFAAGLDEGPMVAGTVRWRRWTGPRTSVELAAGPGATQVPMPLAGPERVYPPAGWRPAALAEGRANLADLAAVSLRGAVVPRGGGRTHGALFVGASTGSTAAVAGTFGVSVLVALVITALAGGGS